MDYYKATTLVTITEQIFKFAICLWPYHPECTQSHLTSEANQGPSWLELGWEITWDYQVLYSRLKNNKNDNKVKFN